MDWDDLYYIYGWLAFEDRMGPLVLYILDTDIYICIICHDIVRSTLLFSERLPCKVVLISGHQAS